LQPPIHCKNTRRLNISLLFITEIDNVDACCLHTRRSCKFKHVLTPRFSFFLSSSEVNSLIIRYFSKPSCNIIHVAFNRHGWIYDFIHVRVEDLIMTGILLGSWGFFSPHVRNHPLKTFRAENLAVDFSNMVLFKRTLIFVEREVNKNG